jgi:hypothetical protein
MYLHGRLREFYHGRLGCLRRYSSRQIFNCLSNVLGVGARRKGIPQGRGTRNNTSGSRKALCAEPEFGEAFKQAKARVRNMDVRFVEESDPTRQALLEIYASVVLRTKYNDFDAQGGIGVVVPGTALLHLP